MTQAWLHSNGDLYFDDFEWMLRTYEMGCMLNSNMWLIRTTMLSERVCTLVSNADNGAPHWYYIPKFKFHVTEVLTCKERPNLERIFPETQEVAV